MTDAADKPESNAKKWRNRALIFGVLLGLVCKSLPPDYQSPCAALAHLCTAGTLP